MDRDEARQLPHFEGLICNSCDLVASPEQSDDTPCIHCGGVLEWWYDVGCTVCGASDFVDYSDWSCGNSKCWGDDD